MLDAFITLTPDNLAFEHLCCIIRSKKPHPGVEAKRAWLADRLREGHVFRKLDVKGCCFIEYAPVETAWVPVEGERYLYIYCLWVDSSLKGRGYGTELMTGCLNDARARGAAGVCMLGAAKQKNWLSNQAFARRFGFETVDATADGYELLAISFDGSKPRLTDKARAQHIDRDELTIYYSMQCPFILQKVEDVRRYCQEHQVPLHLECVDTLAKAKDLPCVFNNWGAFYHGRFVSVNLLDTVTLEKLLKR